MKIRAALVKFKTAGETYLFDAGSICAEVGDILIVETNYGLERGILADVMGIIDTNKLNQPLKKIVRVANEDDLKHIEKLEEMEKEAFQIAEEGINKLKLDMKLIDVHYEFGASKAIFFFSAEERVDFRKLVKYLSSKLKVKIEMRQIGVRDEAKFLGGIGICGRPFCCNYFLKKFIPVTIQMAKRQGLPLNPSKISGHCGRLICCVAFEDPIYCELEKTIPFKIGDTIVYDNKEGKILKINLLTQTLLVQFSNEEMLEIPVPKTGLEPVQAETPTRT